MVRPEAPAQGHELLTRAGADGHRPVGASRAAAFVAAVGALVPPVAVGALVPPVAVGALVPPVAVGAGPR